MAPALSLRIEQTNPPIKEADVARLEASLQHRLPDLYRQFLLDYNGGIPYDNVFDVRNNSFGRFLYNFVIRRYLGLNARGGDDLLRTRNTLVKKLPDDFLPIAVDHFRNFMCMKVTTGEVYFFDLQSAIKAEWPKKMVPLELFLYPVAQDFEAMLDLLYHKSFN